MTLERRAELRKRPGPTIDRAELPAPTDPPRPRLPSETGLPYPGAERPTSVRERLHRLWPRLKRLVVHNVLHLDDTPHRIGMGVFLGFFIGFTPTIGLQLVLYFALCFLLRANTVSGLVPIWFTNPVTAVPVFYTNWRVGSFLLTGRLETSEASRAAISTLVDGANEIGLLQSLFSPQFYRLLWEMLQRIGGELWVGSLFMGVFLGGIGYFAAVRGVQVYRARVRART